MFNISKLTREHSLTIVAFHQTLGVHMSSHAKWGTKSKHDMQIREKPRIGLKPYNTTTNISVLIIRSHKNHLTNNCKESNNQNTNHYKKKKSKTRWRCDTYLKGMECCVQNEEFWWKGSSLGELWGKRGEAFMKKEEKRSVIWR